MQKEIIFNNSIPRLSDLQLIHLLIGKALLLTEVLSALRRKEFENGLSFTLKSVFGDILGHEFFFSSLGCA